MSSCKLLAIAHHAIQPMRETSCRSVGGWFVFRMKQRTTTSCSKKKFLGLEQCSSDIFMVLQVLFFWSAMSIRLLWRTHRKGKNLVRHRRKSWRDVSYYYCPLSGRRHSHTNCINQEEYVHNADETHTNAACSLLSS